MRRDQKKKGKVLYHLVERSKEGWSKEAGIGSVLFNCLVTGKRCPNELQPGASSGSHRSEIMLVAPSRLPERLYTMREVNL